jgi:hypothetical protein
MIGQFVREPINNNLPVQRRSRAMYSFRSYISDIMIASSTSSLDKIWCPIPGSDIPSVIPLRNSSRLLEFLGYEEIKKKYCNYQMYKN